VWAGPFGPRCLADYGADVVAVQTSRRPWSSGVPFSTDPADPLAWEWILRNRRSIDLDLATDRGREAFTRLAAVADVVVENFSSGTLPRWGLTYEVLAERNRRLIMLSMPPMGSSGPWSGFVTYGPTLTGLNGMKSLHGYPEDGAVMEEAAEIDPIAAAYGVVAVFAALACRNRTGVGQHIELAQGEAGIAGLAEAVIEHSWNGRDLGPVGNTHRALAPHGMYRCRGDDQWIAIACATDDEWRALARVAGHEEWLARPEFATPAARRSARRALDAALNAWTAGQDKWELTHRLQAELVPAFPVLDAIEVVPNSHFTERRGHFDPGDRFPATQLLYGNPWHLSAARPLLRRPGPAFGAHTAEVLSEWLGVTAQDAIAPVRQG
jgi:benzylsuccinate CoA-transferase BbsF subunit